MSQETRNTIPKFTQEQLAWLERVCPENLDQKATHAELAYSQGRRSVLNDIKLHVSYVVRDLNTPKSL